MDHIAKTLRKRLSRKYSNYALKVADAYSLPYPESTFDLVMNSYMFDLLPEEDFPLVLAEFRRVMKPGGRIVITSMTPGRTWYSRFGDWLIRKAPNILEGCRPITLVEDMNHARLRNISEEYVSQLTLPSLAIFTRKPCRRSIIFAIVWLPFRKFSKAFTGLSADSNLRLGRGRWPWKSD
jgi:ubiquinone/menaquinone biosynthesis C-methylase UbiE